ncbi:phosphotransferase-like protein [Halocatena salina]|uniref:phosphotransferase-like protein n=1 Tax=Halocatena salina TaxID=2934340 RepID=UPI0034A10340
MRCTTGPNKRLSPESSIRTIEQSRQRRVREQRHHRPPRADLDAELLSGYDTVLVGVRCPLNVLKARERSRPPARRWFLSPAVR